MTPSIKDLYAYALSEGEGVGTAYEYYVKRRVMSPLLPALKPGARILIAGLPEKYGTSLDFVLLGWERGARLLLVDDRAEALERARRALDKLQAAGKLAGVQIEYRRLGSMLEVAQLPPADLVLSCEVVQRLPQADRAAYVRALRLAARAGALFVPNSENGSHLKISGLAGLDRAAVRALVGPDVRDVGYTDLPPFPPGVTRSPGARERAASGALEAIGMWGLGLYSAAEPLLPAPIKRRVAHIVYARWS